MHDVYLVLPDRTPEAPHGAWIGLERRCDGDHGKTGRGRAFGEWLAGTRGEEAAVAEAGEPLREPQRLSLATAPPAFGVHVQDDEAALLLRRCRCDEIFHGATCSPAIPGASCVATPADPPVVTRELVIPPRRILLASLDNLGDLVFSSALSEALRERFPSAEITLWCKSYTAPIGPLLPGVDVVEAAEPFWDRAPGGEHGSTRAFLRSVLRLREHRFDVAVLAAAPWRTAAAVAATGARRRIGVAHRKNAPFLTDRLPPQDPTRPVLEEMGRLLVPLGVSAGTPLAYRLETEPLESRRERFRGLLGPRPVALHPFASKRNRCVPIGEWIRLAEMLEQRGYDPLWIGSAHELREVRREERAAGWHFVSSLGEGTLADAAAAISLASLFVGHDSGPLHLAGAFGVPVVGIFAPGEPLRTFPQGVGPWAMLSRPSPDDILAEDMLRVVGELPVAHGLRLVR